MPKNRENQRLDPKIALQYFEGAISTGLNNKDVYKKAIDNKVKLLAKHPEFKKVSDSILRNTKAFIKELTLLNTMEGGLNIFTDKLESLKKKFTSTLTAIKDI